MKKTLHPKLSFKAYEQHLSQLFPSSLDEWIPENHLVRRFLLRDLEKVTVAFGLVAMAHNFMQLWQRIMLLLKKAYIFASERLLWVSQI